ncbi:hypothetical protein APICC_07510 [Apis cerana cerana]|uniref:Uncharacterized protein n=1 Tax=Apis cerana cerana TaxID=94128 RepID=A0A2A3E186_APICC|nr:hypothetical protein APICC_07510 [Apis cerana cerana]
MVLRGRSATATRIVRHLVTKSHRGSLPWRPAADMGTNRRDTSTLSSPGFSRSEEKIRIPPQLRCSSRSKPYLPARGFKGTRTLIQKRKLFPDLPTVSPGHFGLSRRTLLTRAEWYAVPLPGSGIGTGFPFAQCIAEILVLDDVRSVICNFVIRRQIEDVSKWRIRNNVENKHEAMKHGQLHETDS